MSERRRFVIKLTAEEAGSVIDALEYAHQINTADLTGTSGYRITDRGERDMVKQESAALRRVRDALRRRFREE